MKRSPSSWTRPLRLGVKEPLVAHGLGSSRAIGTEQTCSPGKHLEFYSLFYTQTRRPDDLPEDFCTPRRGLLLSYPRFIRVNPVGALHLLSHRRKAMIASLSDIHNPFLGTK